ncbi:MAG TPA: hypothetical protein VNI79_07515 [Sphingomicrobium sp.]|nr:hypothetical protein [Sphingomicrobium sp.]
MMKLDKRVLNLEAKRGGAVSIKTHLIAVGSGQTREQAKDTYGRDRIGPDDMVIFLFPMSAVPNEEDTTGILKDQSDEAR